MIVCYFLTIPQVKYKEAVKKEARESLYHRLPETLETQRVKEVTELQSEVRAHRLRTSSVFTNPPNGNSSFQL